LQKAGKKIGMVFPLVYLRILPLRKTHISYHPRIVGFFVKPQNLLKMKKVLFAAFAGLCVASSLMGTTATKSKHVVAYSAMDTVPKPDSPKFAQFMDTVPKPDSPKYAMILDTVPKKDTSKYAMIQDTVPKKDTSKYAMILDTVPKKDTSKYASVAHYVMDTVPKHDTSKLAGYVAMK
jgi:hypothetical protein